ncbi:MAG: acetate--CoA ligase family protein [Pseudomonadota bacterium]
MNPRDLIKNALSEGATALSEADSKKLLASYGVPVVPEFVLASPGEAAAKAEDIGFPVVLKALGAKLTHKTERGLVRLGLGSREEVLRAASEMAPAAGNDLEGWLIQPQVIGKREFVAGLFHDSQFGPAIMFGLGGIFTEALGDVVFRLAPLSEAEAGHMLGELRSSSLLDPFRGEAAVDRQALVRVLVGLSRLALELPEVFEVDINPLLVDGQGRVTAVDALVILGKGREVGKLRPPAPPARVGSMFHPKSVVFVGASSQFRKWGNLLPTNVMAGGFEGEIFLVNDKGGTINGREACKSVAEIAGQPDLAVVTVPAARVLPLLDELADKNIKNIILITSGFAETGPEGRLLEEKLTAKARERDLLILGPNTMGICNPHHKFHCIGSHVRPKAGPTAFVSQSGNMGVQLLAFAEQQGIGIRAFGGSGNEAMLTIEDTLDAFEFDRLTTTVLLYIESVKNGRRFFDSARRVSRKKPVVVLKGGRTEAGSQAAASHTGALASNVKVFDAACRQAGVILSDRSMDLLDLSAAFSSLPLPKGKRVGIMTLGGGWGVVTADLCCEFGLTVPPLSEELMQKIDKILPPYWSRSNPIDLVGESDPTIPLKVMDELLKWDGCDSVINLGIMGRKMGLDRLISSTLASNPGADRAFLKHIEEVLIQFEKNYAAHLVRLMKEYKKPIVGVSLLTGADDQTVFDTDGGIYKGIFFPTPERAVKVLSEMAGYYDWLDREGVPPDQRGL